MLKKIALASCLLVAASCSTVPITGRRQLSLVSDTEMNTMAATQYRAVLDSSKVITSGAQAAMVKPAMKKAIRVARCSRPAWTRPAAAGDATMRSDAMLILSATGA